MSSPEPFAKASFSLSAINLKAFSAKYMLDRKWYLRRERLLAYTLTQVFGMAAQGAATFCMFKYRDLRHHILIFSNHTAHVNNDDIFSSAVLTMTFPAILSIILTTEYFLLLFWPDNVYPRWWNETKRWVMVGVTAAMGATVILSTIVVTSHTGFIAATAKQLTDLYFRPPLNYSTWPQNIAMVVLTWLCFACNVASLPLMLMAIGADPRRKERKAADTAEKICL